VTAAALRGIPTARPSAVDVAETYRRAQAQVDATRRELAAVEAEYEAASAADDTAELASVAGKLDAIRHRFSIDERALASARERHREASNEVSRAANAAGREASQVKVSRAKEAHAENVATLAVALTEGVPLALQCFVDSWTALTAAENEARRWTDSSPLPFRTGREAVEALQAEILRVQFRAASPAEDNEFLVAFRLPKIPGRTK
jgi:hypothetical protein